MKQVNQGGMDCYPCSILGKLVSSWENPVQTNENYGRPLGIDSEILRNKAAI